MTDVKLKILNKIVSDGNDFFCFEGIEKFGKRFKETVKKMNIEASFAEAWKQVKREEAEND